MTIKILVYILETSYRYPSGGGWRRQPRRVPPAAAAASLFDTLLALSLSSENKTSHPDTIMDFPPRNILLVAVLCVVLLEVSTPSSSLRTLDEPILLDEEDEPSMPPEEGDRCACMRAQQFETSADHLSVATRQRDYIIVMVVSMVVINYF